METTINPCPLISVVIPVYNGEKTILNTILNKQYGRLFVNPFSYH